MFRFVVVFLLLFFIKPLLFASSSGSCISSPKRSEEARMKLEEILFKKDSQSKRYSHLFKDSGIKTTESSFDRVSSQLLLRLGTNNLKDTYQYFLDTKNNGKAKGINWILWLERAPAFVRDKESLATWIKLGKAYQDSNLTKYVFDLLAEKFKGNLKFQLLMLDQLIKKIEANHGNPHLRIKALLKGKDSKEEFYLEELEQLPYISSYIAKLPSYLEMRYLDKLEKNGFENTLARWNTEKLLREESYSFMMDYKDAIEYRLLEFVEFNFEALWYILSSGTAALILDSKITFEEAYNDLARFRNVDEAH
ncbi:MAG: hypothetical protein VX642_06600 [Bdellovibrionota bacterium]|nr:hypothetical protein [Bdellovibrionota bacterium]